MSKTPDAFRTISEVAEELDLPQHVLRFWETKFAQIKPLKRPGGRRYYRTDDVALVATIKGLLYGQGYTIKGVQRILKENGVRAVVAAAAGGPPLGQAALPLAAEASEAQAAPAEPGAPLSALSRDELSALAAELGECARILKAAAG